MNVNHCPGGSMPTISLLIQITPTLQHQLYSWINSTGIRWMDAADILCRCCIAVQSACQLKPETVIKYNAVLSPHQSNELFSPKLVMAR